MVGNRIARRDLLGAAVVGAAATFSQAGPAQGSPTSGQSACDGDASPGLVTTPPNLVVKTRSGPIRGFLQDGIRTFRGVPYAAPPVGPLRFKPPVEHPGWKETRWTLVQGPSCPQFNYHDRGDPRSAFIFQRLPSEQDEDCLQLNVWTPEINGEAKWPVMVWLHGGAFLNGSAGASFATDGANLARRSDVVVVSINHRLNIFGHLDLAQFGSEYEQSVNAGSLDMVMALRWVRDNIARFGGDPGNVTIFGQSGGGAKVATLMVMPAARGLFHKACIQSSSSRINSVADGKALAEKVFDKVGRDRSGLDRLLRMSSASLVELATEVSGVPLMKGIEWRPVVDGTTITQHPFVPTGPRLSANIPLLIGGTRHEFSMEPSKVTDERTLEAQVIGKFGQAKAADLLSFFRSKYPHLPPREIMALINVAPYRANHVLCADRKAELGGAGCYSYVFAWKTPQLEGFPLAFHASELPFIFGNTREQAYYTTGSADALLLSHRMQDAWIAFARTGNPNHSGIPHWPKYQTLTRPTLIFDTRPQLVDAPFADETTAVLRASG